MATRPEICRGRARRCEQLAAIADDEESKLKLLALAVSWESMAREAELETRNPQPKWRGNLYSLMLNDLHARRELEAGKRRRQIAEIRKNRTPTQYVGDDVQ